MCTLAYFRFRLVYEPEKPRRAQSLPLPDTQMHTWAPGAGSPHCSCFWPCNAQPCPTALPAVCGEDMKSDTDIQTDRQTNAA